MKKKRLFIICILVIFLFGGIVLFLCLKPGHANEEFSNNNKDGIKEDIPEKENDESSKASNKDQNETTKPSSEKPNTETESSENKPTNETTKPMEQEKQEETTASSTKPAVKPTEDSSKKPESSGQSSTTNKPTTSDKEPVKEEQSSSTNKPTTNDKETSEKEEPVKNAKEQQNDEKRKKIESTYGVKIQYGDEIGNYKPHMITPVRLTDPDEIDKYLDVLNTELAKYPNGFFKEMKNKQTPLTIILVQSVNGAFSGLTDSEFGNNIRMTLVASYFMDYTFHHEMMHYIDKFLEYELYPNNQYTEYMTLNPAGFSYGNVVESYTYHLVTNQKGAYFVSEYGQRNVLEDRAEVFKYMMARAYKPTGCFEKGEVLRQKAELISKQIRDHFQTVTGTAHWDRFIT